MSDDTLLQLLRTLRDGASGPDAVARVRAALRGHPVVGDLDPSALFVEEPAADAAALLVALGDADGVGEALRGALTAQRAPDVADDVMSALFEDDGALAPAVAAEAGRAPDVAAQHDPAALPVQRAVVVEAGRGPELAASFDAEALPIAAAVAHEAGSVDVTEAVLARVEGAAAHEAGPATEDTPDDGAWLSALLDHALEGEAHLAAAARLSHDAEARATLSAWADQARLLREALGAEAGPAPNLWRDVAPAVGIDDPEAVPGWDETLLGEALRAEAGAVDVADAVLDRVTADVARDVGAVPEIPEPANAPWLPIALVGMATAAAALLVVLPRYLVEPTPTAPGYAPTAIEFASADEMHVDKVQYGENQSVFVEVPEDDDAPIIIWVDDGAQL